MNPMKRQLWRFMSNLVEEDQRWQGKAARKGHMCGARLACAIFAGHLLAVPANAQAPLPLSFAMSLAAREAPAVDTGTLLAFAWQESGFQPWVIHDNTTKRTEFPKSRTEAIERASTLLASRHGLDLGLLQVNSANFTRTGLTVATAFDPARSLRAGASILVAAYQRCLHGTNHANTAEQQAALRCAASVYNTGDEWAGILKGYQTGVWRAAAQVVPAIQLTGGATSPTPPSGLGVVAPEPRRPPPGLEDALHLGPLVPDGGDEFSDALHLTNRRFTP
jgi:type IV secretion system protein VirB1